MGSGLAALGGTLAACQTPPPGARLPDITFTHLPKIVLGVQRIEVVDAYKPPLAKPNVEQLFPVSPAKAALRWAQERLQATGNGAERAVFTVHNAAVIETRLGRGGKVAALLTDSQEVRYDATLDASLEIVGRGGSRNGMARVTVSRLRTLPKSATINERERAWFEMVERMMQDLDTEMEAGIARYLAPFLVSAPAPRTSRRGPSR